MKSLKVPFLSFKKSHKIGSDERISQRLLKSTSTDHLIFLNNSLELLRNELAVKDKTIQELRQQLYKINPTRQHPRRNLGQRLVRMTRSASIKSFNLFFGKLSRSSNSNLTGFSSLDITTSSRRASRLSSGALRRRSSPMEFTEVTPTSVAKQPLLSPINRMPYQQLFAKTCNTEPVDTSRLEEFLDEESLLERLCTCEDFLIFMKPGDLVDRKYKAMLTAGQFERIHAAVASSEFS